MPRSIILLCILGLLSIRHAVLGQELAASENCNPMGVRLALGRNFVDVEKASTVSIWFNTKDECSLSYILVEVGSSIFRHQCLPPKSIKIGKYVSHTHACYTDKAKRGEAFQYMAYGMGLIDRLPIPSHDTTQESRLPSQHSPIRMVVLADWSYLINKLGTYDPLDDSFSYLLAHDSIDLLYVNGDIAYDLSSNSGKNYEDFLRMLSQVAVKWPTIMVTGNHERKTATDYLTFKDSFETFDMVETNLTTIDLGVANLLIFDPFEIVLAKGHQDYLYTRFQQEMDRLVKIGKPIICSSHYPLACSGTSKQCKNDRTLLMDFYQSMIDHHSVFYFGAHYHTYERTYPYVGQGQFDLGKKGPYQMTPDTNFLLAVVEGISGNDDHIVESYSDFEPFTAAISYNQTGFGLLSISSSQLGFEHYSAKAPQTPIDAMTVDYSRLMNSLRFESE